jgi:hypothetical protein
MDFEDGIINEGQTIDEPSNPISLLLFKREINVFFKAQGFPLIEGIITLVIIRNAFLSETAVVLGTVTLSYNLNHIIPILFPTLMVEVEELFQSIEFGHLQVPVELLQGIVDP